MSDLASDSTSSTAGRDVIYSALKPFAYPDRLRAISSGQIAAPVQVRVKPINACNHRCWFCAYRADQLELGDSMSLKDQIPPAKMDEIVEDFAAMGVKAVTFSGGGEPLIYKHIVPTVRRLGRHGIQIGTLTNGAFLRGDVADAFAEHATWVRVSMDGWDNASYMKFRSTRDGEFDRIVDNIERFIERKTRCSLGVSLIIGRENAPHVHDFCARMKQAGVRHVKLSACVVSTSGKENNEYHATFKQVVDAEITRAKSLAGPGFEIANHYHEADERFERPYSSCPMARLLTVIGADCRVYTCQDKAYTDSGLLGSIREKSFREFWFSDENARRLASIQPSRDCLHHCVSHRKNMMLSEFLALDPEHASFV